MCFSKGCGIFSFVSQCKRRSRVSKTNQFECKNGPKACCPWGGVQSNQWSVHGLSSAEGDVCVCFSYKLLLCEWVGWLRPTEAFLRYFTPLFVLRQRLRFSAHKNSFLFLLKETVCVCRFSESFQGRKSSSDTVANHPPPTG